MVDRGNRRKIMFWITYSLLLVLFGGIIWLMGNIAASWAQF
jgi:hypothetical protein